MDTKFKALIALIATVLLWGFHAVISRSVVQQIPPMLLSLLRMATASILFFPLIIKFKPWKKLKFKSLIAVSLLSASNVLFFIWGVKYTTASASQLIYAAIPVFMVIINIFILREKISSGKIAGVLIGFTGLLYIIYLSSVEQGRTITGNLNGNLIIVIAMFSWLWYVILSKKMTKYFSPIEIGGTAVLVTCVINFFLAVLEYYFTRSSFVWNSGLLLGGLYMGVGGTFLAYIFYQYAIKNLSTLEVSMSSYLQPIVTALIASAMIGEKLTIHFILGSTLVFSGIFLTTTLEVYKRRK